MRTKHFLPHLASFLSLLTFAGACGQGGPNESGGSHLNADAYYQANGFPELFFTDACKRIREVAGAPASYTATLNTLFQKAAVLDPTVTTCEKLATAFQGRKLDLKGVGDSLELGLIVKLVQPKVVDLSHNDLTDEHLTEFATVDTNGSAGRWELSLQALDLSHNKIEHVGDLLKRRSGVRLLENIQQLNLADNVIVDLDDFPGDERYTELRALNLANNPIKVKIDPATGKMDRSSSGFNFLANEVAYLDISNTRIESTAFLGTTLNNRLLFLNLDGLTFTEAPTGDELALTGLIYASARHTKGLPANFFGHAFGATPAAPNLSVLDLSGSDLTSLNGFTQLPQLDVLLLAKTRITDFSAVPAAAPALDALSIYKSTTTAPITFPTLGLLDAQGTSLLPGSTYVTVKDSCSAPKCMVGPKTEERGMVAAEFALCPKNKRNADGSCQVAIGACNGPVTDRYDANNLLVEMCCETSAPIVVGEISVAPVGGKVCSGDLSQLGIYK